MNIFSKKKLVLVNTALLLLSGNLLYAQESANIQVENTAKETIVDYVVEVPVADLKLGIGDYKATAGQNDISPVEIITDVFGVQKALFLIPSIDGKKSQAYQLTKGDLQTYPKRTSAELTHKIGGQFIGKEYIGGHSWVKTNSMTLPGTFTDHSYYIKYEGPGWESDKVAFRFYLDNRNAIDIFAKATPDLSLVGVGMDNFANYHNLAAWGMDNLKVGPALGLGSIAAWDGEKAVRVAEKDSTTCTIAADGKIRSQVKTTYHGWQVSPSQKVDLTSLISIDAGSRGSHIELVTDKPIDNIATGIIKLPNGKLSVKNDTNNEWSYIATFGRQSLNKDMQGLVVFARTKQIRKISEDALNHVLILQPDDRNYVEYYIMSTWELDVEPIRTEAEFQNCIDEFLLKLNQNIKYKLK